MKTPTDGDRISCGIKTISYTASLLVVFVLLLQPCYLFECSIYVRAWADFFQLNTKDDNIPTLFAQSLGARVGMQDY